MMCAMLKHNDWSDSHNEILDMCAMLMHNKCTSRAHAKELLIMC